MSSSLSYALITPARNEADFIRGTIESVCAQTVLPRKWVIVSDGSTDATDAIVTEYLAAHPWIELVQMPARAERHFAGKVFAFNAGYERVKDLHVDAVGNLDADTSFDADAFEYLLGNMAEDAKIGVAGIPFREGDFQYDYRYTNVENVWGGFQLFRSACYESIGGYRPLKGGCIDHVAVLSARMAGWKTRTFTGRVCRHHREMGTALQSSVRAKVRLGQKDYTVGNHPLWQLFRSVYQMSKPPYITGGLAVGWGYFSALFERRERPMPKEFVDFVQQEQKQRLKRLFRLARKAGPQQQLSSVKN